MKIIRKFLTLIISISMLSCLSVAVKADDPIPDPSAPDNTRYSELYVNAGSSTFTSGTNGWSKKTDYASTCYMRLRWFKFQYYPDCSMPGGYYIYSRLYNTNTEEASNNASFSGVTSPGNYNYSYKAQKNIYNSNYKLKTNSSYSLTYYWVKLDWSANQYA